MVGAAAIRQCGSASPPPPSTLERESVLLAGSAGPRGAMDRGGDSWRTAADLVMLFCRMRLRRRLHAHDDPFVLCHHVHGLWLSSGRQVVDCDGSVAALERGPAQRCVGIAAGDAAEARADSGGATTGTVGIVSWANGARARH